jgi:Asp-tRNA(Asn)/Glu-tRNA(Gln) amidotransferase A subunit family amidase
MPIGLQIVGKPFDEATALKVADAFERSTEWHLMIQADASVKAPMTRAMFSNL